MANYEAVFPPETKKGKSKKGRPAAELEGVEDRIALYNFPGESKLDKLTQLYEDWFACRRCILGQRKLELGGSEDIVFFGGNPDAHILIVGEAPGDQEVVDLLPFVGPAGNLLNILLAGCSDDPEIQQLAHWYASAPRSRENSETFHGKVHAWRDNEFAITNVVSCQPPENRAPSLPEMKACWERLWNIIYIVDPLLIIACGNTALASVTRKLSAQITKSRGQIFDVHYDGKVGKVTYPVMPIFHPSYLGRVADWKQKGGAYDKTAQDLMKAMKMVDFLRKQNFGTPMPKRTP